MRFTIGFVFTFFSIGSLVSSPKGRSSREARPASLPESIDGLDTSGHLACETSLIEIPVPFWVRFRSDIGAITIQVITRFRVMQFPVGFVLCLFSVFSLAPPGTRWGERSSIRSIDGIVGRFDTFKRLRTTTPCAAAAGSAHNRRVRFPDRHRRNPAAAAAAMRAAPSIRVRIANEPESTLLQH